MDLRFAVSDTPRATKDTAKEIQDFSLEAAEFEMVLEMKSEEGLDFESAVKSALASSGNEWLFAFPADRLPQPAKHAAAVQICSGDETTPFYVVQEEGSSNFSLLGRGDIDSAYLDFARNYANVALALVPVLERSRDLDYH